MKENSRLKGFLIKRFLMILLFIAVSEMLINILYNQIVYPWLSDTMKINLFITKVNVGESLATLGKGIFWVLGHAVAEVIPYGAGKGVSNFVDKWAGGHIATQMVSQTAGMTALEQRIYFSGVALISLVLILGLVLPYIVATVSFSRMVAMKVAELEQEEQKKREEYDKRRNLLLSDVAHDLKTPITTVSGYASALVEGQVDEPEKQQEYLNMIYNKSMQMSGLITLLFEYVKLDSEGFSLKKKKEDIAEILRESVAALYTDFEEKGMEVEVVIPEESVCFLVDRVQFQRAINNLLNNVIKHNPQGTDVGVIMEVEEDFMEIQICDNGVLIPKETADYIFEPFVMGDESRNSKSGSGLGLSIVQKIISMHDGEITLRQDIEGKYKKAFSIRMKREEE